MEIKAISLTVYFESPFWVGVFERSEEGKIEVCRVVFGEEPKDSEIEALILTRFDHLRFSPPIPLEKTKVYPINPKRMQRKIRKAVNVDTGIGTKAQQALKAQQQAGKLSRKTQQKEKREQEKRKRFELKQAKKKTKHRGH